MFCFDNYSTLKIKSILNKQQYILRKYLNVLYTYLITCYVFIYPSIYLLLSQHLNFECRSFTYNSIFVKLYVVFAQLKHRNTSSTTDF